MDCNDVRHDQVAVIKDEKYTMNQLLLFCFVLFLMMVILRTTVMFQTTESSQLVAEQSMVSSVAETKEGEENERRIRRRCLPPMPAL